MTAQQAKAGTATTPARRKGPRPKHVPQRMCVACREHAAKRTLTRVVRTPEGTVAIDPTGKRNGRGAYLCERPACWESAVRTGGLARALKRTLEPGPAERLLANAATMTAPGGSGAPPAPREGATG